MGNWLQIQASLVTCCALKPTTSSTMLLTEKSICHYPFIKKPLKKFQRPVAGCHADSPARPSLMSTQFYPTEHSSFKSGQQSKEPGNYSAASCVTFFCCLLTKCWEASEHVWSHFLCQRLLFSLWGKLNSHRLRSTSCSSPCSVTMAGWSCDTLNSVSVPE